MIIAELVLLSILISMIGYNEIVVKRMKNYATSVFILLFSIMFVIVPLILHVFFGGAQRLNTNYDNVHYATEQYHIINIYGFLIVLPMFLLSYWGERRGGCQKPAEGWSNRVDIKGNIKKYMYLMPMLGLLIFLVSTGMSIPEIIVGGRFSWYGNDNSNLFLIAISHYFFSSVPVCVFLHMVSRENDCLEKILFFLMIVSILFYSVLSYDRKWIFYFFSSALAGVYFLRGFGLALSAKWTVVSGALFVFVFFSQFLRDYLLRYMTNTLGDTSLLGEIGLWVERLIVSGDVSYFYRSSCELVYLTIENGVVSPGAFLSRNLLFFLPSGLSFGLKPEDVSTTFSGLVNGGSALREGDMPPGFYGIIVASFGLYISALFFIAFPFVLKKIDKVIRSKFNVVCIVLLSSFLSLLILFMRGDDSSALYFFIFNLLLLKIIKEFDSCFPIRYGSNKVRWRGL